MRRTLRVNPRTHLVCVPASLVEDGLSGDVDAYVGTGILLLVPKDLPLGIAQKSVAMLVREIKLQEGVRNE